MSEQEKYLYLQVAEGLNEVNNLKLTLEEVERRREELQIAKITASKKRKRENKLKKNHPGQEELFKL